MAPAVTGSTACTRADLYADPARSSADERPSRPLRVLIFKKFVELS
jgi:hypothetical protein